MERKRIRNRKMADITNLISMIKKQQGENHHNPTYMIGMQLIDMAHDDERIIQILVEDLQAESMSLGKCADAMKQHADEIHRKEHGSYVCIPPDEAEKVIRKFYGLPEREAEPAAAAPEPETGILSLEDFL